MHLAGKFGQMFGKQSVLAGLVLFGTFLALFGSLEIQEYAILFHTACQQQTFVAKYITASCINNPVYRSHVL